jgi:hypothetical protein
LERQAHNDYRDHFCDLLGDIWSEECDIPYARETFLKLERGSAILSKSEQVIKEKKAQAKSQA